MAIINGGLIPPEQKIFIQPSKKQILRPDGLYANFEDSHDLIAARVRRCSGKFRWFSNVLRRTKKKKKKFKMFFSFLSLVI